MSKESSQKVAPQSLIVSKTSTQKLAPKTAPENCARKNAQKICQKLTKHWPKIVQKIIEGPWFLPKLRKCPKANSLELKGGNSQTNPFLVLEAVLDLHCQYKLSIFWLSLLEPCIAFAFYRIFPKIHLTISMQTFFEMSTNLHYYIYKLNTSSFKIRVD